MTPPNLTGRRASRHRILRQLGHGNLTRVFLATPLRSAPRKELVVLKLMHPELARDHDFRALFLDQAATALSLRHPNLVRALEVVADPDACGMTLEFLPGQTLARVLERVGRLRFPVDLHLHILSQVLEAIDHVHRFAGPRHSEPGFMHRDVCPSNVFITYDGQVKLLGTGFGNAVRALESRLGRPLLDVKYAAPEVLLGYPSGSSADLFALGVMVWEAVTRQARISSDDPKAVVRRRTRGEELNLESAWPDAPEPLIALCARALAVSPRDRYPTALEFRADLDAYLSRASEPSDSVLARLPELMEASFGPEREQMQLFIGARLGAPDDDAEATEAIDGDDDETTSREDEWTAETNDIAPPADREGLDAGFRTGLRRARPEPGVRRATGVHEKGLRHSGAQPRPAALEPSARAAHHPFEPRAVAPGLDAPAAGEPTPTSAFEPPAHETTTAGHRAYSSNLDANPGARRSGVRWSPDVLGAVALLLGSLVAVYSIYRHSQRDKRPESQKLAVEAEARGGPPAFPSSSPARALARPLQPAAAAPAPGGPDAGAPIEERRPGPAFFDGRAEAPRDAPPALRADELPAVDPALRSLQDAIVVAAKAHRFALERRRARKAEPKRPSPAAPAAPRPIDEADPYTEGSAP
jgi:serine/threonine protein kinase